MLAELLKRVGETYDADRHMSDFGLESAERVADFYNNGGLEYHVGRTNYAFQYVSLEDFDKVHIGAWVWEDGEDFDLDATFEVYDEDDFTESELKMIADAIRAIYEAK